MEKLSALLIWPLLVVIQCFVHERLIVKHNSKPVYWQWNIIRGIFAILHGILFNPQSMLDYVPVLIYQFCTHYAIFNPLLNFLRGLNFWYLGKDSGPIDRVFREADTAYRILYCSLLVLGIYLFVYIVRN